MLLKLLREGLGRLVILISFFIPTGKIQRNSEDQQCADQQTASMSLYQFYACPFCLKARRAIKRLGLNIETRDAQTNPCRAELQAEGGKIKVPCLRIDNERETIWLYESTDIIAYLEQRFGESSKPCSDSAS